MYQQLILFYYCIVFHPVNIPLFLCTSSCWWKVECFHFGIIMNKAVVNIQGLLLQGWHPASSLVQCINSAHYRMGGRGRSAGKFWVQVLPFKGLESQACSLPFPLSPLFSLSLFLSLPPVPSSLSGCSCRDVNINPLWRNDSRYSMCQPGRWCEGIGKSWEVDPWPTRGLGSEWVKSVSLPCWLGIAAGPRWPQIASLPQLSFLWVNWIQNCHLDARHLMRN